MQDVLMLQGFPSAEHVVINHASSLLGLGHCSATVTFSAVVARQPKPAIAGLRWAQAQQLLQFLLDVGQSGRSDPGHR